MHGNPDVIRRTFGSLKHRKQPAEEIMREIRHECRDGWLFYPCVAIEFKPIRRLKNEIFP